MTASTSSRRQLVAVAVVLGVGALSMGIVRPMLPLYLTHIGLEPALLGLIISVSMAGMVIGESLSGLAADRFGLRLPLLVGTVVCGALITGFVVSEAVPYLFAVAFVWGAARAAIFGPGRGFLATAAPPAKKATYLAVISAIASLSRGAGALPGGFIADNYGYDWVFFVAAAVAALGGIAVLALGKSTGGSMRPVEITATANRGPGWRSFLPSFSLQCLIAAFIFVSTSILLTYVPLLGTQVMGISATSVGTVFTINGIATMLFSIPMGMAADRMGKQRAMLLGLLACGISMVGLVYAREFAWLVVIAVINAFGMATFVPAALGVLSDLVPAGRQATVMGLYGGVCENVGLIVGAAAGGFAWEFFSPGATFWTGAVACAIGIVLCLFLGRTLRKPRVSG